MRWMENIVTDLRARGTEYDLKLYKIKKGGERSCSYPRPTKGCRATEEEEEDEEEEEEVEVVFRIIKDGLLGCGLED